MTVYKYNSKSWKKYLGHVFEIDIYLVDEKCVQDNFDKQFIYGTNWMANPEYCPKNEIWITGIEEKDTLRHEFVESLLMLYHNLSYEKAHAIASELDVIESELK